jgi:alpha-D-ribose 1-methylphosphonate 5-triphosphate synthase subunit PhnG
VNADRRAELLAAGEPTELVPLAERLVTDGTLGEVNVLSGPEVGMVMLTVREPVAEHRFQLGEVLVTQCTVEVAGATGWCVRGGDDRVSTLAAALLDGAAAAELPAATEIRELCLAIEARLAERSAQEWAELEPTVVAFEELT